MAAGSRATIVLCTSHLDGVRWAAPRAGLARPISFVWDARQLRALGSALPGDVDVFRTPALASSPAADELEAAVAALQPAGPVTFVNADGVLYPVVHRALHVSQDREGVYAMALGVVSAWGGVEGAFEVVWAGMQSGRSTLFVRGLRPL